MKRLNSVKVAIFICLSLLLVLTPLLSVTAKEPTKPTGELRIGIPTFFNETFHPLCGTTRRSIYLGPMYDYLVGSNAEGNLDAKEGIAYKWEESADNLSWTFYIRDGVTFHNGDPLTLEDVKYSIEQCGSEANLAGGRSGFEAAIARVQTVPPDKVVVYLNHPFPTMLYNLCPLGMVEGMIIPKKYTEKNGLDYFNAHPIGTGPYKFLEWKEGTHIKLEALDSHWKTGVPKYKYLTYKMIPEEGTRYAALRRNEVDVINVGIKRSVALEKEGFPIYTRERSKDLSIVQFLFNDRPDFPYHKKEVRQALVYAIDKAAILKNILMGRGNLMGNGGCSMTSGSVEYKPYKPYPYDPKLAKKLLSEAGYPNGFTMYFYSFETGGISEIPLIIEAIAGYWEAIGVNTKILSMDYAAFKPVWNKKQEPPGPCTFIYADGCRPVVPYRIILHSSGFYSHTAIPEVDKMIEQIEAQRTLEGYIKHCQKVMDYVYEDFRHCGLACVDQLLATSKDVPRWEIGKDGSKLRFEYIK